GQDVPACLKIENNYLTKNGTAPAPDLPHTNILLINPNKGLPTPAVYKEFRDKGDPFSPETRLRETPRDVPALITALKERRNDLYEPARRLMPEIKTIIDALEKSEGCLLARMSGSGATCFGLYADRGAARKAASDILAAHPSWWVAQSHIPYRK